MPVFEYRGLTKDGRNTRGTLDSDNLRAARARLKKDGIFVIDIKDRTKTPTKAGARSAVSSRVNVEELSLMTRQLATLIKSNIPLVEALSAVSDQVENPTLKVVMGELRNAVNEGSSLHRSLAKYPKVFSNIYVSMCEAGEMTGTLDVILVRLAEFTEAQNELRSKIKSAMMYPVLMTLFTFTILIGLFTFVIPKIVKVFQQTQLVLPWYTKVVINISDFLVNYWHILIVGSVTCYFLFRNWRNTPSGKVQWDRIVLTLPLFGKIARMIAVSRFTRTLSTLLAGGVPMLNAMDIVANVVDNEVLRAAVQSARDNISEGESVAAPLKKSGEFPPIVIHMIAIGEKTGELEFMLTQVSDSYDFQVKNTVQGLTSLMEPVMIVIMGVVVGVIVFAIMIPIFELSNIAR